ncbi:histidinol-phosphate transaminase [Prochlorococcus sp. MIT 1341]|uniref:pyridoxal phosphate-dependent aminotransferase n=1 Tax=Prochlorococcus sp. MIT 1341 TaxID=3096221 RepID=UPI002A75910D|nr:histidinol-phosphate transaminase [Prochlorococcus sp. MIT 1341]
MTSSDKSSFLHRPTPRLEVDNLNPYSAPLEGRRQFLRLDFNENTLGPSPIVVNALRDIPASEIAIYPEYGGLREAFIDNLRLQGLKNRFSLNQVGIFNGVDAAIHAIFHAYGDRSTELLTTSPTFGYYAPCAQMQGMDVQSIPYEGEDFQFPLRVIRKTLLERNPRLLFICNPNNPTGTRLAPEKLIDMAVNSPGTLVVVDELYEAFSGDSVLPNVDFNMAPNLLVLRSLAKTAGLAGLRMGFAIGCSEVIDYVSRVTGPYDINSFAVTAAFAALSDQAYVDSYVSQVLQARDWIKGQLVSSRIKHHIDGGNYFLVWPTIDPQEMSNSLKESGILVREMSGKPLIDGSLRVSIGTQSQMEQFWDVFSTLSKIAN